MSGRTAGLAIWTQKMGFTTPYTFTYSGLDPPVWYVMVFGHMASVIYIIADAITPRTNVTFFLAPRIVLHCIEPDAFSDIDVIVSPCYAGWRSVSILGSFGKLHVVLNAAPSRQKEITEKGMQKCRCSYVKKGPIFWR